jgi:hypothetical protein
MQRYAIWYNINSVLILRTLNKDPFHREWILDYQFGFRPAHSTIQQCHRLTRNKESHGKQRTLLCGLSRHQPSIWQHQGLLYKIKTILPSSYYKLLQSYLQERVFHTKVGTESSRQNTMASGVPQGSVLGPILYILYTSDLPTTPNTIMGTFADDTAILVSHYDITKAASYIQEHIDQLQQWMNKWRVKVNEAKSTHIIFRLKRGDSPTVRIPEAAVKNTPANSERSVVHC